MQIPPLLSVRLFRHTVAITQYLYPKVCFDGVDFALPGNGGPDCLESVSMEQRVAETLFALAVCIAALFWARKHKRSHRDEDVLAGKTYGHSCLR